MTIRHLRVFIVVAELENMTMAAEKLFIAQPSVSQTIKELENYYNVKLFERLSKRLYITEVGKQLLSYARHLIALFDEMESNIKNAMESGPLKIGTSVTVGTCLLSEFANQFRLQYPNNLVESVVDNTRVIEEMVLRSEVDFGIVEGSVHNKDIRSIPIMDDELILVCGKVHPFRTKNCIDLEEVVEADFILRENGSGTREQFENFIRNLGKELSVKWVCNNSEAIKNAVISNMGVSVISKMAVEKELKNEELFHIPIRNIRFKRRFCIIYHKNKFITRQIQDFWNMCVEYGRYN